ncbi:hypothetical protein ACQ424_004696, partial [Salmonella enterica]
APAPGTPAAPFSGAFGIHNSRALPEASWWHHWQTTRQTHPADFPGSTLLRLFLTLHVIMGYPKSDNS